MRETETIADDAFLVSDAEEALVNALYAGNFTRHQLDLVHLPRTVSFHPWDDDAFPLTERKQMAAEVGDDVFHFKKSVEKHRPAGEYADIDHRTETTRDRIRRLSSTTRTARVTGDGTVPPAVGILDRAFAGLATEETTVPLTSNAVERAMDEVSKRSWTTQSLRAERKPRLLPVRPARCRMAALCCPHISFCSRNR